MADMKYIPIEVPDGYEFVFIDDIIERAVFKTYNKTDFVELRFHYVKLPQCEVCGGSGKKTTMRIGSGDINDNWRIIKCPQCKGQEPSISVVECDECEGSGKKHKQIKYFNKTKINAVIFPEQECLKCQGHKWLFKIEWRV
jgi:hypothetical protein